MNAIQIKELADLKNFPYDQKAYFSAISDPDIPMAVDKMEAFIRSIKDPLINFKRFPNSELVYIAILVVIYQVSEIFLINKIDLGVTSRILISL